jgi:hypothetical protein
MRIFCFFFILLFSTPLLLNGEEKSKYVSTDIEYSTDVYMFTCQERAMDWGAKMKKNGYNIKVQKNTTDELEMSAKKKGECLYTFTCRGKYKSLHNFKTCLR